MSLMGAFYTGVSGLNASQNSLNTVAHNLANVDTKGYTRQSAVQGNRLYLHAGEAGTSTMQIGLGVDIVEVRSARDYFLDVAYRDSAGRESYYTTQREAIDEITNLYGELVSSSLGTEFKESLVKLKNSIEDLCDDPSNNSNQAQVITNANLFLERAAAVYNGLAEYQDNLNEQIKDQVDAINDIAQKIYDLNGRIAVVEAGNIERANDMRDARNYLLDQLSSYGSITFREDKAGYVTVQFEGVDLVNHSIVNTLSVKYNEKESGFYTPVWSSLGNQSVYDLDEPVDPLILTDKGSLRSLLDARGEKRGCYADMYAYTDALSGETYADGTEAFDRVSGSSVASSMAMFDYMIYNIMQGMNQILQQNKDVNNAEDEEDYQQLFTSMSPDAKNVFGQDTEFSLNHVKVNEKLLEEPAKLANGFMLKADQSVDYDTATKLRTLFSTTDIEINLNNPVGGTQKIITGLTLTPATMTKLTYQDYYVGVVQSYADIGNLYKNMEDSLEAQLNTNETERQSVIGVSDSDELTHMIRYQNAYNASSRYFNVVNEMLEHLLNALA